MTSKAYSTVVTSAVEEVLDRLDKNLDADAEDVAQNVVMETVRDRANRESVLRWSPNALDDWREYVGEEWNDQQITRAQAFELLFKSVRENLEAREVIPA